MKRLVIIAGTLVVLVNAFVLLGVVYNRFWLQPTTLVLQEQELRLPNRASRSESVVELSLRWQGNLVDSNNYHSYSYEVKLPQASYTRTGFSPATCKDDKPVFISGEEKAGWVLLELNGPAYQTLKQQYKANVVKHEQMVDENNSEENVKRLGVAEKNYQWVVHSGSRLIAVDASFDKALLQQSAKNFESPTLILPVSIRPTRSCRKATVQVRPRNITKLYVPASERAVTDGLRAVRQYNDKVQKPRFWAEVKVGGNGNRWITKMGRCTDQCN